MLVIAAALNLDAESTVMRRSWPYITSLHLKSHIKAGELYLNDKVSLGNTQFSLLLINVGAKSQSPAPFLYPLNVDSLG